jgi:hypothetical protein
MWHLFAKVSRLFCSLVGSPEESATAEAAESPVGVKVMDTKIKN